MLRATGHARMVRQRALGYSGLLPDVAAHFHVRVGGGSFAAAPRGGQTTSGKWFMRPCYDPLFLRAMRALEKGDHNIGTVV